MKLESQRITIAKVCGWYDIYRQERPLAPDQEVWRFMGRNKAVGDTLTRQHRLPDYLNDLNAMHEAWIGLTYNQQAVFGHWLSVVVFGKGLADGMLYGEHDLSRLANATAAQRAEAFLKTLGLWEP